MFRYASLESDQSTTSDTTTSSFASDASELQSVFGEEHVATSRLKPGNLRSNAQQLAEHSAEQHFPKFTPSTAAGKCGMLHWACYVGWCLCKYQYQPLTPLHLLPNTRIVGKMNYVINRKLSEGKVYSNENIFVPSGSCIHPAERDFQFNQTEFDIYSRESTV